MKPVADFLANQEAIDYFDEVFLLKCTKYSNLKQNKNMPLGGSYTNFVLNYWPGVIDCCQRSYASCKSFQLHLISHHLPPKKPPLLSIVTDDTDPTDSMTRASTSSTAIDHRNGIAITKFLPIIQLIRRN